MGLLELSAGLALLASVCSGLQAVSVEYGLTNGDYADDRSPTLAAAVISIVVGVTVFWALLLIRGSTIGRLGPLDVLPFVVAGVANPAAFRVLYFRSIDRIGARLSAAVVSANPAVAALLAVPMFGERFTIATGSGLLCIIAGGATLQMSGSGDDRADLLLDELARLRPRDLLVPLTAMLALGCSFVLVEYGLDGPVDPLTGTAIGQTAALAAFVLLFGGSKRSRTRVAIRDRIALIAFTLAGLFVAMNWLAWFSALQLGTVVTVVPLANTYPLFVVAFSYAAVRRLPRSPQTIGGIALIVVGATLMQIG